MRVKALAFEACVVRGEWVEPLPLAWEQSLPVGEG